MTQGKEVATAAGTAVAEYDYDQYAGAGFENTKPSDFKPSFIRVLQGGSPQLETVPGAKPGLIIDTITNELFEAAIFIPAWREHVYAAWKPRNAKGGSDDGKGFGGIYQLDDDVVRVALKANPDKWARGEDGKLVLPTIGDGEFNLVETVYFHGIQAVNQHTLIPVSVPFWSTGLTVADAWFTTMNRQRIPNSASPMPLFAHASRLGSVKVTGGGYTWYNFTTAWAAPDGTAKSSRLDPKGPMFQAAVKVYEAFKKGNVDIDYAKTGQDTGASKATASDAKVPF